MNDKSGLGNYIKLLKQLGIPPKSHTELIKFKSKFNILKEKNYVVKINNEWVVDYENYPEYLL